MSFSENYFNLRKKKKEEEKDNIAVSTMSKFDKEYRRLRAESEADNVGYIGDIAPVVSTVQNNEEDDGKGLKFFKKGAFEDGYQFGDVTKTILGTVGDAGSGIGKGALGLVEGVIDLVGYGVAGVGDLVGADEFAEDTKEIMQMNQTETIYDTFFFGIDDVADKYSVLDRSADAVAQGIGQVGTIIATGGIGAAGGLTSAGTTALTTGLMGASSMGSGMTEAYQSGASDVEAVTYGAIAGAADAATELIFGGLGKSVKAVGLSKGLSSADDILAKKVSGMFSSQIAKNLSEYGIKAGAEGVEEVLAGIVQAVGKKATYMSDEEWGEIFEDENLLEQFVVGAVTSGIAQAGDVSKANKAGRDFITDYTQNEQKVIDKEYENRIAEQEKDGKKLTDKEKTKLYDEVIRDMDKGYISTDTIEEVLGGDTYQSYTDTLASEEDIVNEYNELADIPENELSRNQRKRLDELEGQIEDAKAKTKSGQLRQQYGDEVYSLVKDKDYRLLESYNERARTGQAFEADVTKYDAKQQATIQAAIDSGILNNSNRTHEFVDMVAKLSADKGVPFNFADNAKLKESGFAVGDGKTINGFVTKDGITVNVESAKAINAVVGHEITHILEGTELYTELQSVLKSYAESKGEYQTRYDALAELYKNIEDADIDAELTADLVGDYLFTDADFINNLSTNNRNLFQKLYDEIKYMYKIATAGSKEAKELERVKKAFEDAYRANGEFKGDTKYSMTADSTTDSDGKQLSKGQQDYFKDSKVRDENGNLKVMYHGSQDAGFHIFDSRFSDDDTSFFFVDRNDVAASYSGTSEVYEARTMHTAEDVTNFFAEIGAEGYEVVEENGKFTLLYEGDKVATSDTAKGIYEEFCWYEGVGEGDANYKVYLNLTNPLEVDAKGKNWNNVSREYSQEIADRYHSLTAEEKAALTDLAEWGEYSIFRDEMLEARATAEQGGSGVFDESYTKNLASAYEKLGGANTNLYDAFTIASENFSEESIKQFAAKQMTTRDYAKKAKAEGYDGVIFKNIVDVGGYGGDYTPSTVAVAFDSNQIKSVANAQPTKDADIRYSLSSMGNTFFGNESMTVKEFTAENYKQTQGYQNYVNECLNNYKQTRGDNYDEAVARKEIEDSIDGIVRVAIAAKKAGYDIFDDGVKRSKTDSKNRLLFSSLEPNSDYFTSSDISTICDKRQNFAEIYDDIVRAEEAKGVPHGKRFFDNVDNYFYLHGVLAEKGLTQPCRQCYVESMRKNLAPMASAFLDMVQETDTNNVANKQLWQKAKKTDEIYVVGADGKRYTKKASNTEIRNNVIAALDAHPEYNMTVNDLTVEMLTTEDGLAQLRIQAPLIYEYFNSFYGQAKPKMPKSATPFRFGELTALLTDKNGKIKQSLVDKINATGGFRLQSYSDFQIQNYTDVLQVIFEAGTLGLSGHAYTKVPAFLEATEGTNLKRNISIFMYKDGNEWKLDRNDSFPYTLEEIYKIVNADESGNTSIIAVSQNEDMSAWIMANDYVGYGIPFHKSGLKMGTVRDTIVREDGREIKGYSGTKDHTRQQAEVWATTTADHKALTNVKKGINVYEFWDFDNKGNLSKNELIEKNVKRYIDECEKAGYLPKFREYVMNNGKVLNSTLSYAKELGFVSPDATIEDISFEYKGYTIPYGYYKFLGDFGMFTPDGQASAHETLSLNNYDFDKAVKFFEDSETLRRNEILQQFANDGERQKYAEMNMTAEELLGVIKEKRAAVVSKVLSRYSLSKQDEIAPTYGNYNVYGKDIALSKAEDVAPVQESVQDVAPMSVPMTEEEAEAMRTDSFANIDEADMPPEVEAPYYEDIPDTTSLDDNALRGVANAVRDALYLNNREAKAIQNVVQKYSTTELPSVDALAAEIREQFGEKKWVERNEELADVKAAIRKEPIAVSEHIKSEYPEYAQFMRRNFGKVRFKKDGLSVDSAYMELAELYPAYFPSDIANEADQLQRIVEVANMDVNIDNSYTLSDEEIYAAADIISAEVGKYKEAQLQSTVEAEGKAAFASIDDVAPIAESTPIGDLTVEDVMPIAEAPVAEQYEAIKPKVTKEPRMARATPAEQARAEIMTEEPTTDKKKGGLWSWAKNNLIDKGAVFETLSMKTGNRELQARWNSIRYAEGKAQRLMGEGNASVRSLTEMQEKVEKSGKTKQFYEYLYHLHNADRMTLAERYDKVENKPVFGNSVTAEMSREAAAQLERANPEFKRYAKDVYDYNAYLRELLVEGGVISNETAKLWAEMYPHYVPIRRAGDEGLNINVPLDSGRTGVNAPIKRAKGGNRDILPLFDTMGQRTIQTYKAIAKNRFGVELKNTLGTTIDSDAVGIDEAIDSIDTHDGLLQEGKNGQKPTFTVFENGEKVTFEITEEMYDAMKPTNDFLAKTIKPLNAVSNFRRATLTEYNPWFLLKNAVKDVQDVLINSQHATRTYSAIPKAINQMATKGHWYQEYVENGGENNTYFDNDTNTFKEDNTAWETVKTVTGLNAIAKANNIVEMLPRLAEYIASREAGRSVDVSMLDAARVTTNFAAGGDVTRWANRNGATFLNASVQGATQQVRNIREAKAEGLKGWAKLAGKFVIAGLPALVLNGLIWDDDDEYEELSDYVKQNYYIVGKYGDGQFVRIPKGRTVAVIQNAFEQMQNLVTGDDEVDLSTFLDLVITNLAPNNPLDNNIFSPIAQVAQNKTWYGEDLVPTRLQDVPAAEQYDESTDAISRWLGETFGVSPYKANYLLDQYSGVIGDTFLPMLTPKAESGDNSFVGNMIAPLKDMFTTDSVMNNQNVSDFYDTVDELAVNANSSKATDEDVLKYKYINSVSGDIGELYGMKREIQNSDLPDDEKYEQVREIQRQIDEMAKESLNTYGNVSIQGDYATVGDRHYRWYEPSEDSDAEAGWQKITDKQLEKQENVTSELGISASDYWSNKEEYDYAYDSPEKYAIAKSVGGYTAYRTYASELYDIKADKDESGKSISGSRKEKVVEYINNLDADYGEKIILFKSQYTADDTYNYEIIDYLNGREDISYAEMETILKALGFTVKADGTITWD